MEKFAVIETIRGVPSVDFVGTEQECYDFGCSLLEEMEYSPLDIDELKIDGFISFDDGDYQVHIVSVNQWN